MLHISEWMTTCIFINRMPTANVPLRALGEKGANEWGNFGSGTWEYLWHILLGITRLGRLLAWSGAP